MEWTEIGIFETKTRLSEYLKRVARGERFYITNRGARIAELRPVEVERPRLARGAAKPVLVALADDFDAPLEDFSEYL
jgi:prevent-host-death family protein